MTVGTILCVVDIGADEVEAAEDGTLPTQRRHSRALPRARLQRPISRGGRPESLAQARFE